MKREKNRFVVFLPVFILVSIMMLISVSMFILIMTVGRNDTVTPFVIFTSWVMLAITPMCLWIWALIYLSPTVEINETGIVRKLFFIRKNMDWKDCKEIAMINTPSQGWLFFSESEVTVNGKGFLALSKYRLKKDNIFLASNKRILDIVNKYAPESLLPINYKNNQFYAGND